MRIDGEPWKQPLPSDDDTVMVEISHRGQVNILATNDCRSKSVHNPTPTTEDDEGVDTDEENEAEFRKFGAADTFKLPEEIDISRLS